MLFPDEEDWPCSESVGSLAITITVKTALMDVLILAHPQTCALYILIYMLCMLSCKLV